MPHVFKWMNSPVGKLKLVASEKGLAAVLWPNDNPRRVPLGALTEDAANPFLIQTEAELTDYFAGIRRAFTVPLDFNGTGFAGGLETKAHLLALEGHEAGLF